MWFVCSEKPVCQLRENHIKCSFQIEESHQIFYDEVAEIHKELSSGKQGATKFKTNNVALVALLKEIGPEEPRFVWVACTHFYWNPKHPEVLPLFLASSNLSYSGQANASPPFDVSNRSPHENSREPEVFVSLVSVSMTM